MPRAAAEAWRCAHGSAGNLTTAATAALAQVRLIVHLLPPSAADARALLQHRSDTARRFTQLCKAAGSLGTLLSTTNSITSEEQLQAERQRRLCPVHHGASAAAAPEVGARGPMCPVMLPSCAVLLFGRKPSFFPTGRNRSHAFRLAQATLGAAITRLNALLDEEIGRLDRFVGVQARGLITPQRRRRRHTDRAAGPRSLAVLAL